MEVKRRCNTRLLRALEPLPVALWTHAPLRLRVARRAGLASQPSTCPAAQACSARPFGATVLPSSETGERDGEVVGRGWLWCYEQQLGEGGAYLADRRPPAALALLLAQPGVRVRSMESEVV